MATVKNGTIELEAIPYDGVYDGQAHNAFTSISTNPSDAKLEYSLDGNEYNEEMPTKIFINCMGYGNMGGRRTDTYDS